MIELRLGDCLVEMATFADCSVDAICCDPPAGINFMNSDFDSDRGGRDQWISWLAAIMREALRVAKPGAHAFVWALPRTSHWTMTALEDAGWEIRDVVTHLQGASFPKNHDISKALDKAAGAEREVVGTSARHGGGRGFADGAGGFDGAIPVVTSPATDLARQWEGFGTALKPSAEFWVLCRKPISEKTIALNVGRWGCGALNIAASRIGTGDDRTNGGARVSAEGWGWSQSAERPTGGRWPANTVFSHAPGCQQVGVRRVKGGNDPRRKDGMVDHAGLYGGGFHMESSQHQGYADADGLETVDEYSCVEGCPIKILDEQTGRPFTSLRVNAANHARTKTGMFNLKHDGSGYGDIGGASRFFKTFAPEPDLVPFLYVPKASRRDRSSDGTVENTHPTTKSTALMKYLCTLICPPNGTVLDCFLGSGSTGVAAVELGFGFIGIEQSEEYMAIAQARINAAAAKPIQHTLLETSS